MRAVRRAFRTVDFRGVVIGDTFRRAGTAPMSCRTPALALVAANRHCVLQSNGVRLYVVLDAEALWIRQHAAVESIERAIL